MNVETRRRLEAGSTDCGTTTEECPEGGCIADAQYTPPAPVSSASSVFASSAAFTALVVAVAALA